jgi:hypothetical protein
MPRRRFSARGPVMVAYRARQATTRPSAHYRGALRRSHRARERHLRHTLEPSSARAAQWHLRPLRHPLKSTSFISVSPPFEQSSPVVGETAATRDDSPVDSLPGSHRAFPDRTPRTRPRNRGVRPVTTLPHVLHAVSRRAEPGASSSPLLRTGKPVNQLPIGCPFVYVMCSNVGWRSSCTMAVNR